MRRRRRLPNYNRKPMTGKGMFMLSFVVFIILTLQGIWIIDKRIEPTLMRYAEIQTKRIATLVINKAVNKKVADGLDVDNLMDVKTDKNGNVTTIDFNTAVVNSVLAQTTNQVQLNLKEAEEGNLDTLEIPIDIDAPKENKQGNIYSIPLGQATNSILLASLGPKVPVKFTTVGDVMSTTEKTVEPYGINNAMVTVSVHIEVNVQVIMPFSTKMTKVATDIPVAMRVIQGVVPQYFNGGASGGGVSFPVKPSASSETTNKK